MADDVRAPELARRLGLRDLTLFNIVAVLSIRWIATSAAAGPSSLLFWALAALLFLIPQGLAVSELAARYPEPGGIYPWAKRAFGEGHGFLCGWCYWVNNVLYYPNLLISTAAIATYVIGKGSSGLGSDWHYVLAMTLAMLWGAVWVNVIGVGTGRWLQNAGAIGAALPGLGLVILAIHAAFTRPWANPITAASLVPDFANLSALNLWATIAFAFAGLELSAVMAGEVRDPVRTLPRAILLAAPVILALYIIGTWAMLVLVPVGQINVVSGFIQAVEAGAAAAGAQLVWVAPVTALLYVVGNLGGVGAWLTGPARVAFVIGLDRYFPKGFGRIHPKWRTPYVAILVQAGLATVFLFVSVLGKGTTVERAYLVILDTMLLVYFIPYLYLFTAYLIFTGREPTPSARGVKRVAVGVSGLLLVLFAMAMAVTPPSDTPSVAIFELKVVGGALAFLVLGGALYWRAVRKATPR
ncbi:MAG TPA: APC family permease [Gemmatimonadales bacterium]|nr:APC family permease [Gemmatimonadales bacterium]